MPTGPAADAAVLVAAGRADWEPDVLAALARAHIVVLRRCVDVVDLIAVASTGSADVAVVAADLDGLDAEALRGLWASGSRVVAVGGSAGERDRLTLLGVPVANPTEVVAAVQDQVRRDREALASAPRSGEGPITAVTDATESPAGRVVAVLGATGAPGRSTVATALAAERSLSHRVVLCDVDPYAGSLAQGLGVLDETSGLLAAALAVNEGTLDDAVLAGVMRSVAPGLDLLTGLPRADRWVEVRPGVVEAVAGLASGFADVVLDCGFGLSAPDPAAPAGTSPARINTEALDVADRVVVVGSAEPVALARLARALVEVVADRPAGPDATPVTVVVNRMRAALGWRRSDITAMVGEVAPSALVAFWPYERATLDRAALRGVALTQFGETPLRECARALVGEVFAPEPALEA